MTEDLVIPITDQGGNSYRTMEVMKDLRSKLEQKIHTDSQTPHGVAYGDAYYHQALGLMIETQTQLIMLQTWCRYSNNTNSSTPNAIPQTPKQIPTQTPVVKEKFCLILERIAESEGCLRVFSIALSIIFGVPLLYGIYIVLEKLKLLPF